MSENSGAGSRLFQGRFFADIPEERLLAIARIVQNKVVPARTIVFEQGDRGDSYFIINSGNVRVFKRSEEGLETDLAHLGAGEGFGEMALLTGEPRSACVQTLEETHLTVLPKEQFDSLLSEYPHISLGFIKQLSGWLLQADLKFEAEAGRQFRVPGLSWLDFLVIFGLSLLFGITFNLSNPHGISLVPKSWSDQAVPKVSPASAMAHHGEGKTLFVDAKPSNFFEQQYIRGAMNMPLAVFDIVYMMELGDVDLTREIIVYGRTISRLYDEQVARKLILRGHKNVRILDGGLSAWKRNGYPVES